MSVLGRVGTVVAVLVTAAALVFTGETAANAHVSVSSTSTAPGTWAVLSFSAPTESADASAVSFDIHLPADTPFTSVRVQPVAGWSAQLVETVLDQPVVDASGTTIESAVTEIVWTADEGGGFAPGEFGVFDVSVGPLPDEGTLFFPVVQHYSDGTEVGWVQQAADGEPEPEHPAPKLTVSAGGSATSATATGSHHSSTPAADAAQLAATPASGGSLLGVIAVVLAFAAVVLAGIAVARTRRR